MINKILSVLLIFVPHPLNAFIRRMFGQNIGENTHISIFSFVFSKKLLIGKNVKISPFSVVKANEVRLSDFSHIESFAIINGPSIDGGNFELGRHSRVFPFCWIEPGEGVYIGDHVGIGGHTLIFTHGSWSDYLHGGPVQFGPVYIEDHVWIPWRVFIMPGVTIGTRSIIAANSTVVKSTAAHTLVAGSPGKVIKENINQELSDEKFKTRIKHIFEEFEKYEKRTPNQSSQLSELNVKFVRNDETIDKEKCALSIDMNDYSYSVNKEVDGINRFISFLRRYGIRLEEKKL